MKTVQIRKQKCGCGENATGYIGAEPYCTRCYNRRRYSLKTKRRKELRRRFKNE